MAATLVLMTVPPAGAESPAVGPSSVQVVATNMPGVYAFTQPPADFDAMKASQDELASWGYPPRPAASEGAEALAEWQALVNPANTRAVPQLVRREQVADRAVVDLKVNPLAAATALGATSNGWSGIALVPNSGAQPYSVVTGRWIVPTAQQPPKVCSGGWDYSAQWVGLGGFNDSFLLKVGSAANAFCDIGENVAEYFPFMDWLPGGQLVLYKDSATGTLFPFAAGDYLNVTLTATNFSSGASTTATVSFIDETQHWSVSLSLTAAAVGGSQVTGESAEWIVERPAIGGALATLADYTADPWWATSAKDLGAVTHYPGLPGTATAYNITMLDDSNASVSFVDLFGKEAMWFFAEGSAIK